MSWYIKVLKNYAGFSGRAQRAEYWMFTLFSVIISLVLSVVDGFIGMGVGMGMGLLYLVYTLGVLIPTIAVTIRRLHDTNRSGWMILIGLIPLIGAIILIVFLVKDSDAEENRFGGNPKAVTA